MSLFPSPEYKTPGQLIDDLLIQRGWTKRVLAVVLGCDETALSKIVSGKRPLDAETALSLSEIFNVQAETFLQLQKNYDLAQARLVSRPDPGRAARAHLFGELPVSDMIKRGWIDATDVRKVQEVEAGLTKFFKASSASEIEILPHAAKRTNVTGGVTAIQLAWLYRVKEIAEEMLVSRYSDQSANDAINRLSTLRYSVDEVAKIPRILQDAGIRFLIVESLPGSKIDGVCYWLNDSSPVVAMSLRHDRIDNFWFVLRHELEHVKHQHGRSAIMLDVELEGKNAGVGSDIPEEERIANAAACEFCVPQKSMGQFFDRKYPTFADRDILMFSRAMKVHPGLVAGQLRYRLDNYKRFSHHLPKVREIIAPSACVDGWGDILPVGI